MPKPRIILFFAIAAGLGQIVRISNVIEIVDWGRPGSKAWCFCMGSLNAMLSRLSFMKPVLALAFHECASNGCLRVWHNTSVFVYAEDTTRGWFFLGVCFNSFVIGLSATIYLVYAFLSGRQPFSTLLAMCTYGAVWSQFVLSKTAAFGRLRRAARVLAELWSGIRKAKHLQRYEDCKAFLLYGWTSPKTSVTLTIKPEVRRESRSSRRRTTLTSSASWWTTARESRNRTGFSTRLPVWGFVWTALKKPQTPGVEIVVEIVVMEPMMAAFCTLDHPCSVQIYLIPWSVADLRYCYLMSPDCYCYACEAAPIKNHLIIRSCVFKFSVDLLFCSSVDFQFCSSVDSLRARNGEACCGSCDAECTQCCQCMNCSGGCTGVALEAKKNGRFTEWEWMKLKEI